MTSTPALDLDAILHLATAIAEEAGELLLARIADVHTVDTKSSPVDAVTEVDRAAEALIVARILEARPDDGILGEEGADRAGTSGVRWVVDPLDGTVNYLYQRGSFCVSIGVEDASAAMVGVVRDPSRAETFVAVRGRGATLNGAPIHVSTVDDLSRALIGTGFGYEVQMRGEQGPVLARMITQVRDIRRQGSAALDLCAVACGRLDGYFERGLNPWDSSAGALIVREAGGHAERLEPPELPWSLWLAAGPGIVDTLRVTVVAASNADSG